MHQIGYAIAELTADIFDCHVRIFNGIVKCCRCQQFLVGRDSGHYLDGFHRVHDIRKAFATTLGVVMRFDGEDDCAIKQVCI